MEVQNMNEHLLPVIILGSGGAFLLTGFVIYFFVRYQKKAQQQKEYLLKTELAIKEQLLHTNIQAQEEERVRISKDLHDHVGSTLSSLRFLVNRFDTAVPGSAGVKALTGEYKEMIDGLITDVRNISHSLAPPGLAIWGLHETLAGLCEKVSRGTGIDAEVTDESNGALNNLSFDNGLALFRVMQELINNTLRHAAASQLSIIIAVQGDSLIFTYSDDGKGTDADLTKAGGMGMGNISSRLNMIGATREIETAAGKGFTCRIKVPVPANKIQHNG